MKEINWQDLKSFLTALAVGDFKSAANIILEEPVEELVRGIGIDYDQEFRLGNIILSTLSSNNIGSQLERMIQATQWMFAMSRNDKPATLLDGYGLDYMGVPQHPMTHLRYIESSVNDCVPDREPFQTLDGVNYNVQQDWLKETHDVMSRRNLIERKFMANFYAWMIHNNSKLLATNKSMLSWNMDRTSIDLQNRVHNGLKNNRLLNAQFDYGDLATSLLDYQGMYNILTHYGDPDNSDGQWYADWNTHWSDCYEDHDQYSWEELKDILKALTKDVDSIYESTTFKVDTFMDNDSTYKPWGFKISFKLHGSWYIWKTISVENDLDYHMRHFKDVKYSKSLSQPVPKSYYEGIATQTLCPYCDAVVKRHPETVPFIFPQVGINRKLRACFDCVEHFAVGYSLAHESFVGNAFGGLTAVPQTRESINNILSSMNRQTKRNIERRPILLAFFDSNSGKLMEVRFVPDFTYYEYRQDLDWHLYLLENGNYNIIKSSSANHGPTTYQADASQKSFFLEREALPIGMELEIQYRDNDHYLHNKYIEQLLTPLHKKFPYERPTLGQRQQLAIGTRDSSIGSTGIEFKFQVMSSLFVNDLPEEFFETLKNEWRGYHAKKCGIHLSTSKSALNRPESFVFLTYHNNHVRAYHNQSEDDCRNIMGDVFQRVDVPNYAEWHEVKYESGLDRNDYATGRDYRYASYLNAVVRNRQSVSRGNFINFASADDNRLEIRAFASATLKDRILKNFEYVDAVFKFSRDLAQGLPDNLDDLRDINSDRLELLNTILSDEIGFYFWLDRTGGFRAYPNLAAHLERHNIDRELSKYTGDIQNALQDI